MSNKTLDKIVVNAKQRERDHIVGLIKRQICFDALADHDAMAKFREVHPEVVGRCGHHGGKCTDLLLLVESLIKEKNDA